MDVPSRFASSAHCAACGARYDDNSDGRDKHQQRRYQLPCGHVACKTCFHGNDVCMQCQRQTDEEANPSVRKKAVDAGVESGKRRSKDMIHQLLPDWSKNPKYGEPVRFEKATKTPSPLQRGGSKPDNELRQQEEMHQQQQQLPAQLKATGLIAKQTQNPAPNQPYVITSSSTMNIMPSNVEPVRQFSSAEMIPTRNTQSFYNKFGGNPDRQSIQTSALDDTLRDKAYLTASDAGKRCSDSHQGVISQRHVTVINITSEGIDEPDTPPPPPQAPKPQRVPSIDSRDSATQFPSMRVRNKAFGSEVESGKRPSLKNITHTRQTDSLENNPRYKNPSGSTYVSLKDRDITPQETQAPPPPPLQRHGSKPGHVGDETSRDSESTTPTAVVNPNSAGAVVPDEMAASPSTMSIAPEPEAQNNPSSLSSLLRELGMFEYFPCKLSLQKLRTIDISPEDANVGPPTKNKLALSILKQIMLMNKQCREDDIRNFAKYTQPKNAKKIFGKPSASTPQPSKVSKVPHPMDMMLVLFMCSDYAVRQILARKLFMCRLAIPFIIPGERVEVMLWTMRSIILEWKGRDEAREEALVKCKMNMVAFMRYGGSKFSKSGLMNDVLSSSGHTTFFHKGSPCGNEKRVISNGTVEMSHFLPAANQQDVFQQPALFFNLRGDACSYDVQRQVLMDLATALVIVVDISELRKTSIQEILKDTVSKKQERVAIVLTDDDRHDPSEAAELNKLFCKLVGGNIDKIDIVTTFDEQQNSSSVIQDIREAVSKKMAKKSELSLEEYVTSKLQAKCDVDEHCNKHCSRGKEVAANILKELKVVEYGKRKETFLPKQGEYLSDLGNALRRLHRTSRKDADTSKVRTAKETISNHIASIREKQARAAGKESFTASLISMFHENRASREFAMRWIQMALDDMSRSHLPLMHKEKNICWRKLTEARSKGDSQNTSQLEDQLRRLEKNIAAATCGWEHLMRELGQQYEVSLAAKHSRSAELSFLPKIVGRQLLEGHPVELMDGDHGIVPFDWVKAVFQSLIELVGNKKILVLSVLGIQSSGKSTLLNAMFGLEFAVSAGRCTRGIYAQLLPVRDQPNQRFDYMLAIDSEGLRSHQREQKYQYDNELATLVIGLSDVALINMKGENITEMADVLQIVVHAFLRMKLADTPQKRQCMFIHQNVAAVNAQEKLADDRQKLQEQLDTMTKEASLALGLSQAITSFNRVISFDSQQDVVYFPDLWSGDPPMAAINQGYSRQAGDTQHVILHRLTRDFTSFINFEEFVVRTHDMWNGVLSDDFIFSFRNTLAAKAYIDVERELERLKLEVEQALTRWVNTWCDPRIRNCESEDQLTECFTDILRHLQEQISFHMDDKENTLRDFFENHSACDVIEQWKSEKVSSFQNVGPVMRQQIETNLHNSKVRKLFQLRQSTNSSTHKAEIHRKAIGLAEKLRGKGTSPEDMQKRFDELWNNWASDLTAGTSQIEVNVLATFSRILSEQFTSDEVKFLTTQLQYTPLVPNDSKRMYELRDIHTDHIVVREKSGDQRFFSKTFKHTPKKSDFFQKALEAANVLMRSVLQHIDEICSQDTIFTSLRGKETLDVLWKEIADFNALPYEQAGFVLTPQFKAMLAVRTSCIAIAKFEKMNQRYEEQYGVQAQMKEYKERVFVMFKNSVKQASSEITAAECFWVSLKAEVGKQVREEVKNVIPQKISEAFGTSKRELVIALLEEIAETKSYESLCTYVWDPSEYAKSWLQRFIEEHLFARNNGKTKYSEYAETTAAHIFTTIKSSVLAATTQTPTEAGTNLYWCWLVEFCRQMEETVYLDPSQLWVYETCIIEDYDYFQLLLTSALDKYQKELLDEFQRERTVSWIDSVSQKIYKNMWGCMGHCPFCKEPCQFLDSSHKGPHKCIQHKPPGVRGTHWIETDKLLVDTCDFSITTGAKFNCLDYRECDKTEDCKPKDPPEHVWHNYSEYKKYFPDWDITPNPSGEASKFWQWIMCTFRKQLLESYPRRTLEIPEPWKKVTKQEAIASLREY